MQKAHALLITYACCMVLMILLHDCEEDFITSRPLWARTGMVTMLTITDQVRAAGGCQGQASFGISYLKLALLCCVVSASGACKGNEIKGGGGGRCVIKDKEMRLRLGSRGL
jgi:hypothetical protein